MNALCGMVVAGETGDRFEFGLDMGTYKHWRLQGYMVIGRNGRSLTYGWVILYLCHDCDVCESVS